MPRPEGAETAPLQMKRSFNSNSENQTFSFAEKLGRELKPGAVVALTGPIGSGKTVFIKGLSKGLGVKNSDDVKSPTFVLLHLYKGKMGVYHFDLYRLEQEKDLDAIGFDEFVSNPETVSLIEWGERAQKRIPKNAVWIQLKVTGPHSREIEMK